MNGLYLTKRYARAAALTAAAFALLAAPVANPAPAAAKGSFYFDFEQSLKPWFAASEGHSSQYLEQGRGDSVCNDIPVNHYAVLGAGYLDNDDAAANLAALGAAVPLPLGTWMSTGLAAGAGPHLVSVSLHARSEANCEGCDLKLYAGDRPPAHITDFEEVGEGRYLKAYWQQYTFKAVVDLPLYEGGNQTVHVGIGWADTNASIGIDCVIVDVMPNE
jgi:hypothetical protein